MDPICLESEAKYSYLVCLMSRVVRILMYSFAKEEDGVIEIASVRLVPVLHANYCEAGHHFIIGCHF